MISLIFMIFYGLFVLVFLFIGSFLQRKKESRFYAGKKLTVDNITLLVPYRNEDSNLKNFLTCLEKSSLKPKQVIFIDDHSSDNSTEIIQERMKPEYLLLRLTQTSGKKEALREGISHVQSAFILTMDADVRFSAEYFEMLTRLEESDLYLLPVVLKGRSTLQIFFELDLLMVNATNTALYGWARPIVGSGANLLFKKEIFYKADRYETHRHVMSGDDIYLLRDFRKAKADIRVILNNRLVVYSDTPSSLAGYFHQRLRWISKTRHVKDHLATFLGLIQTLFVLSFCSLLIFFLSCGDYTTVFGLFCIKTLIDLIGFLPYFSYFRSWKQLFMLIPYQLIYPIYLLILGVLLPFIRPIWKQRITTTRLQNP